MSPARVSHLLTGSARAARRAAHQLGKHLVEDVHTHWQFCDCGTGEGEVRCRVGHASMVNGAGYSVTGAAALSAAS